jgi:hypothetical protein
VVWFTRLSLCLALASAVTPSASFASDSDAHVKKHPTPQATGQRVRPKSVRAFPIAKLHSPPPHKSASHRDTKPAGKSV